MNNIAVDIDSMFVNVPYATGIEFDDNGALVVNATIPIPRAVYEAYVKYPLSPSCITVCISSHAADDSLRVGDLAMIDTAINRCEKMGLYVVENDGELHVKRIRRTLASQLQIISASTDYPTYYVAEAEVNIVAKVVCGWKIKR